MATALHPAATTPNITAQLSALLHGTGAAELDDIGWIRVTGEDRVRWLNGMVTNSIESLKPGEGNYNFVLNAQGRIQADLTAFAEPDTLYLKTDRSRIPALIALLDRFIIMDDVELTDISTQCDGITLTGPQAATTLERVGLPTPHLMQKQQALWQNSRIAILQEHSQLVPRIELWGEPAAIATLHEAVLAAGATPVSPEALEHLRILEGTPLYGTDIRDRDLPQETAQTRALHFSKGCYLGQEIVERIRSRGAVHRTFTGFRLTGTLPAPGTALEAEGKPVGELTSTASIPLASGPVQLALGYIRREALDRNLPIQYPGGTATPITLPYPALS